MDLAVYKDYAKLNEATNRDIEMAGRHTDFLPYILKKNMLETLEDQMET